MSQFASKARSPHPVDRGSCDLPYGLTWADLGPVLATAGGCSGWCATTSYRKQGLDGGDNSCIITLARFGDDQSEQTVFVKRTTDPYAREAAKYQLLGSVGVPVPKLLAAVSRAGAEIIVLEFLPRIGIDFHSHHEVQALLELVARLNAADISKAEIEPPPASPSHRFDESVRSALLKVEGHPAMRLPADLVIDAYERAQVQLAAIPLAPNHGELYLQQVGWAIRDGCDELVMFDLATLALRPRFVDVAGILPLLVHETQRSEAELFAIYLDGLARLRGSIEGHANAHRELRLTRVAIFCWALPWLSRASTNTGFDLRAELALKLRCLCDDVEALSLGASG